MFRVFDVPSMASSVCVDSTFSKNGDGKVCFWYLTKSDSRVAPRAIYPTPGWRARW